MTLAEAFEERKEAKFMPKCDVHLQYYDCVTFALSLYKAIGVLPADAEFPRYSVFSKGDTMLKMICDWVGASGAFTEVDEVAPGALLVVSQGFRGHHVGVALERDLVAHCCRRLNVTTENISAGLFSTYINKIYLPNGME